MLRGKRHTVASMASPEEAQALQQPRRKHGSTTHRPTGNLSFDFKSMLPFFYISSRCVSYLKSQEHVTITKTHHVFLKCTAALFCHISIISFFFLPFLT